MTKIQHIFLKTNHEIASIKSVKILKDPNAATGNSSTDTKVMSEENLQETKGNKSSKDLTQLAKS